MDYLTICEVEVEAASKEDSRLGRLARAIRPEVRNLTGDDGKPLYSVHSLFDGRFHIERKKGSSMSLEDASSLIEKRFMHYVHYAEPLIQEMIHVLDCDLQHMIDNGHSMHVINSSICSRYFIDNLGCLDGYRSEAVNSLNSKLVEYVVPEQFRFN